MIGIGADGHNREKNRPVYGHITHAIYMIFGKQWYLENKQNHCNFLLFTCEDIKLFKSLKTRQRKKN